MRKILLATTALVAFAGAAQAAESPIQVTLGGYVDFRAALFHEAQKGVALQRRDGDFQTEYGLDVAALGKAAGGIEYGAKIALSNAVDVGENTDKAADELEMDQAYIHMSGPWGKVLMGDEHGASDLFVYAPTVGEGQIDGSYINFTSPVTLTPFQPAYVNLTENDTKVTYYTPKVGNANHKIQLGVSYTPNPEQGILVAKDATVDYRNQVEASAQYTGVFGGVNVVLAPMMATGEGQGDKWANEVRDYTVWGVGGQASYAGFTFGTSFVDAGKMGTAVTEDEDQEMFTVGLSYGFDKTAVAVNYMDGEGYDNGAYRDNFSAVGLGATYTWFPGLTTAADAVFFDQSTEGVAFDNEGAVFMVSQKMAF